jgi:U1 small nuclear ribonucleoprotein 70kDa
MSAYLQHFEATEPPKNPVEAITPRLIKEMKERRKDEALQKVLEPQLEEYRKNQKTYGGEFEGMNCYNTLFVGRLAYEVTERRLLREMEAYGAVKDIKIIKDKEGKSRGYAFVEYEHEEDMKRAYRAADKLRVEGREIVVDVERGHTVPSWLPRRLGGGLGGTRLGGKDVNVTRPGRFDPARPEASIPMMAPGGMSMGRGAMPHYGFGGPGSDRGPGSRGGPPPPRDHMHGVGRDGGDRYGGPPPPPRGGDWEHRKRQRSRSPDRGRYGGTDQRRRY